MSSDTIDSPPRPRDGSEDPPTILMPVVLQNAMQHGSDTDDPAALVGREALLERLTTILLQTYKGRGSYLLAGYRGAGKTNIANRAIARYQKHLRGQYTHQKMTKARVAYIIRVSRFKDRHDSGSWYSALFVRLNKLYPWLIMRLQLLVEAAKDLNARRMARVRFFGPETLRIRVNLSKSHMTARDVMFEITSMLRTKVRELNRRTITTRSILLFLTVILFAIHVYLSGRWAWGNVNWFSYDLADLSSPMQLSALGIPRIIEIVAAIILVLILSQRAEIRYRIALTFVAATVLFVVSVDGFDGNFAQLVSPFQYYTDEALNLGEKVLRVAVIVMTVAMFVITCASLFWYYNIARLSSRLKQLNLRILATQHKEDKIKMPGFWLRSGTTQEPLDESKIEDALIELLNDNSSCRSKAIDPVFVIDELDKIEATPASHRNNETDGSNGVEETEAILINLKNLLTVAKARFFVIAGRDMLDRYQAERRAVSSLYETLFDQYFEVPSLLTDKLVSNVGGFATMTETYVCRRIIRKHDAIAHWIKLDVEQENKSLTSVAGDALTMAARGGDHQLLYLPYRLPVVRAYLLQHSTFLRDPGEDTDRSDNIDNLILLLRQLIHYLTFYSAGNCKKLESLFDSFVRPVENRPRNDTEQMVPEKHPATGLYLRFSHRHRRRIILGSVLYGIFYHHMSRQLRVGGDKLAVSSLSVFHHILKFHAAPFSRHQLDLVVWVNDAYRAPELDNSIDTLIAVALRGLLLKVPGGLYQYRFSYAFEQELKYNSRTSDMEAATYNFSLSAMESVRLRLQRSLRAAYDLFGGVGVEDIAKGAVIIAELNIDLGEIFILEQDLRQAETHFATACDTLQRVLKTDEKSAPEIGVYLVEAFLKLGLAYERRSRLDRARSAFEAAKRIGDKFSFHDSHTAKRNLLSLPELALQYLRLKRSPASLCEVDTPPVLPGVSSETPDSLFRSGEFLFYAGKFAGAKQKFRKILSEITERNFPSENGTWPMFDEATAALGANTALSLAEAILADFANGVTENIDALGHSEESGFVQSEGQPLGVNKALKRQTGLFFKEFERFLGSRRSNKRFFEKHVRQPGALCPYQHEKGKDGVCCSHFWEALSGRPDLSHVLALSALAGHALMMKGKYYRAGMAYLRGVTLWCMSFELVPVSMLNEAEIKQLRKSWEDWRPTVAFMLKRAERNLADSDDRGAIRFRETFLWRDLAREKRRATGNSEGYVPLRQRFLATDKSKRARGTSVFFHDASILQQLTWTTVWGDLIGDQLLSSSNSKRKLSYLSHLNQCQTPLFSTRALTFSHWITGRIKLGEIAKSSDGNGIVPLAGAQAAQNLYAATKHLQILASNDQSLMFPPQAFVFFHLWQTLAKLVERQLPKDQKKRDAAKYVEKVEVVRQELIKLLKRDTTASYLDLRFVKDRALRYLRAAENMADATGRVRAETIRRKYLLAGDFADPQFHLEWTLIQAMRPTTIVLQRYIKNYTEMLQGEKIDDRDADSLWNYSY